MGWDGVEQQNPNMPQIKKTTTKPGTNRCRSGKIPCKPNPLPSPIYEPYCKYPSVEPAF